MKSDQGAKLAYIVSRFPTVTETFILREINELERLGQPLELYTIIRDEPEVMHQDAETWMSRLHSAKLLSAATLFANLRSFIEQPLLYLSLIWITVSDLWGCWNFLVRDLALLPVAVAFGRKMQAQGIQHVHVHWATHPAYMAYIIHRLTGLSYSVTAHAHDIYIRKAMLCRKVRAASFVATISHFNVEELVNDCGPDVREKLHVIRCGVLEEHLGGADDRVENNKLYTILTIASLRDYKGHPDAIKACALVKQEMDQFQWLVVGGGPDQALLEQQIKASGVEDKFHLLGSKTEDEVAEMIRCADLFVMSSVILPDRRMDGIPVALMEAMAAQLPVVATAVSGIPELVEDGVTGHLVEEGKPQALALAILDAHQNPDRAVAMAQTGKQRIVDEFTISDNVQKLNLLFNSQLETQSRYTVASKT